MRSRFAEQAIRAAKHRMSCQDSITIMCEFRFRYVQVR
jgi:hypothetical protein